MQMLKKKNPSQKTKQKQTKTHTKQTTKTLDLKHYQCIEERFFSGMERVLVKCK